MARITEDYVSFETAKLLNDKGFDEPCFAYYSEYWDNWKSFRLWKKFPKRSVPNKGYLNVPTLQMAMKWLREVHTIDIVITPSMFHRKYNVCIYKDENLCCVDFDGATLSSSYEYACEAAIKYCLENLI